MWRRIDRDQNGFISRQELDCEEFRYVVKSVLAPSVGHCMGGAVYARAKMNMDQAINLCLRKADMNQDFRLSFHEFKSFMLTLRQAEIAHHTGHIIFSLFDVDTNNMIDDSEFREMWRFFLAREPTREEFAAEWAKLDTKGEGQVSRELFLHWLQRHDNPVFARHGCDSPNAARGAPGNAAANDSDVNDAASDQLEELARDKEGWRPWHNYRHFAWHEPTKGKPSHHRMRFRDGSLGETSSSSVFKSFGQSRRSSSLGFSKSSATGTSWMSSSEKPKWNSSFGSGNPNWVTNKGKPRQMRDKRNLFSRPQSLPQLQQFYDTRKGFESNSRRMSQPEPRKKDGVLSHHNKGDIELLPTRGVKAGCMPHPATGQRTNWEDNFIQMPQLADFYHPAPMSPIGNPPEHLYKDLYDSEDIWEGEKAAQAFSATMPKGWPKMQKTDSRFNDTNLGDTPFGRLGSDDVDRMRGTV